ncbi:hypothetical protein PYCC9005_000367 [Savitreella phatthalungensis]
MSSSRLVHFRLPSPCRYAYAADIQDGFVRMLLDRKQEQLRPQSPTEAQSGAPGFVLTAQFLPVYTTGRRERGLLSEQAKLELTTKSSNFKHGQAEVIEALRGGQMTYHGPGQLVAYPIVDLHNLPRADHGADSMRRSGTIVRPRCYVDGLESVIIRALARHNITARRTEHTGVWIDNERKISSIGVHLRRNVTSHGISINVDPDLDYFRAITACGLADKQATSCAALGQAVEIDELETSFIDELATSLGYNGVDTIHL